MKQLTLASVAIIASMSGVSLAKAQDLSPKAGDVVVRGGAAIVRFDEKASFVVAGTPQPDSGANLSNEVTVALEGDYYFRPDFSVSLTLGIPPKVTADGTGHLAALGRLGSATLGNGVLQANYHFTGLGALQPWAGVGVTRLVVFKNKDGAVKNLDVKGAWGSAFQVGADYMLTPKVGVYGSVAKLLVSTDGTAMLGAAPVKAKIDLDPLIYQAGVALRF